mgnify:CR=1 FL=1
MVKALKHTAVQILRVQPQLPGARLLAVQLMEFYSMDLREALAHPARLLTLNVVRQEMARLPRIMLLHMCAARMVPLRRMAIAKTVEKTGIFTLFFADFHV